MKKKKAIEKYCSECGSKLIKKGSDYVCPSCTIFCSKCGIKNSSTSNYCEKCGNNILQLEAEKSQLEEAKTKGKVSTSDSLLLGKDTEVEDFNIPFDKVFDILEEHMQVKLKKLILKDRKKGQLIYVTKDIISASALQIVTGKTGIEIHIQIAPITQNKTRVKVVAKPVGYNTLPMSFGPNIMEKKKIKEIFKVLGLNKVGD